MWNATRARPARPEATSPAAVSAARSLPSASGQLTIALSDAAPQAGWDDVDGWIDRRFLDASLKELKLDGYWPVNPVGS